MRHKHHNSPQQQGFTLVELMVAAALGAGLSLIAGTAMVSHLKSNARAESLQRLREDWNRATSFIESEIAISSRIFTNGNQISLPNDPNQCNLSSDEVVMALDLARDLPLVIYGIQEVSTNQTDWILPSDQNNASKVGLLIRCGPSLSISSDGTDDYQSSGGMTQTVLLDGIDMGSDGSEGFNVTQLDAKSASFVLQMVGIVSTRYGFGSGTYSRINPVAGYPEEASTCSRICKSEDGTRQCPDIGGYRIISLDTDKSNPYVLPTTGLSTNDNVTICSLRASDSTRENITGSEVGDVIDALPQPRDPELEDSDYLGATINGLGGRNILLGTPGPDVINGGPDADTLISRNGGDELNGGNGSNSYLPWGDRSNSDNFSNVTINGGTGLDVVYLRGTRGQFEIRSTPACTSSECFINALGGTLEMRNVEVLIFKDGRIDLP
tara:strand:+ start:684 stop:2000 length:1317 start_codon:yes stop_codon:yes gene_type:complete